MDEIIEKKKFFWVHRWKMLNREIEKYLIIKLLKEMTASARISALIHLLTL